MLGFLLGLLTLGWIYQTPTGHTCVVTNFGTVKYATGPGIHAKSPLGIESATCFDTRVQKVDIKTTAGSKDLQDVHMELVVNYHLDPNRSSELLQKIGDQGAIEDRIITPAVNEVVKAATAQLTAEETLTKRPELKQTIDSLLGARLQPYYVSFDDVSLVNIDFSDDFNKAIEAKQVAEQQAQQAKFTAQKAEQDAQAAINKAKGDAEAQRLQQQTLTPELLQKQALEKWNGVLPVYMGAGPVPFLNLK